MLDVALTNLGAAWLYLKEYQNARQTFLECAALEQRLGNRSRQAVNLHNLMYTCWEMGDYGAARDYGYQAMTLFKEVQQQQYLSLTYATLAEIELANDDLQAAGEWQQQALELAQTLEMEWVQLSVLLTSAVLLRAQGEQVQAVMVLFFVQQHETAFAEHRERAEKLLSELEPSPAQMAQAQATIAAATVKSLISNLAQAGKRCLNTHCPTGEHAPSSSHSRVVIATWPILSSARANSMWPNLPGAARKRWAGWPQSTTWLRRLAS